MKNQYHPYDNQQPQYSRRSHQRQDHPYMLTEEERTARRRGRAEARRLRERARRVKALRRMTPLLALAAAMLAVVAGTVFLLRSIWPDHHTENTPAAPLSDSVPPAGDIAGEEPPPDPEPQPYAVFHVTPATVHMTDPEPVEPAAPETPESPTEPAEPSGASEPADPIAQANDGTFHSKYAILIDLDEGTVLAEKGYQTVIHPASMTKILTILVAAEHITDFSGTVTVTKETTDYCLEHNCSIAGFLAEEEVPVMDLFYGTILPSGADAALTLAEYTAGSHAAFVELMNEKAEELGIAETAHFANCVGLYDERNVCTVYDMAVILKAAMDNGLCRQILGQRIYDIPASELHPEGVKLSNWFIRRIEDHMPEGVVVKGAKTGFINQSGNCSASLAQNISGRTCICVTAMAGSSWQCIFDHVMLYEQYGFQ